MKKVIMVLMFSILLIGVNAYSQGDLVVNGKIGVGQSTPASKLQVDATDLPTFEGNFNKTANTFYNANSMQVTDSSVGGTKGTTALLFNLFHSAAGGTYSQGLGAMNASVNLDGGGTWSYTGGGAIPFNAQLAFRNESADYDLDTVNLMRLVLFAHPDFNRTVTADYLTGITISPTLLGTGTINGTDWYGMHIKDFANNLGGSVTTNISTSAGLWMEKQTIATSNYGMVLNGNGAIGDYGAALVLGASQNAFVYGKADGVYVYDGTAETKISPHDPETGEWIYYSKNIKTGKTVRVDMARLVKAVEKLTGETFMVETLLENK